MPYLSILILVVLRPSVPAEDGRAVGHRGIRQQQVCRPEVFKTLPQQARQDHYAIADVSRRISAS
jgi:hypothetical protein